VTARDPADGPVVHLRIVGIEASPLEIPPLLNDLAPVLHLTPAFAQRYAATIVGSPLAYIRLKQSSDLRSFQSDVERLANGRPVSFISTLVNQRAKVERSLRVEALILAVVTALLALAGGIAVAQTMSRQAVSEAQDDDVLRGLGMERAQIRGVSLVRSAVIGLSGALIAVAVAWFLSPFTLLSNARLASLQTGFHLDPVTVTVASAAVFLFAMAVGTIVAARPRAAGDAKPGSFGVSAGEVVQRSGVPMSMALGVRFALRGHGRSASLLTMLLSAALGVATITMAATFTSLLHRSLSDPHRYGWNWDFKLGAPGLPDLAGPLVPALRADPLIRDLSAGSVTQLDVGSTRVDVFAFDAVRGAALPTVIAGRAPQHPDEIVLGERTARDTHTDTGTEIRAQIGARSASFRVVGTAVFPEFGDSGQLGTGAWTTVEGLQRITHDPPLRNTFLVGLQPAARAAGGETQIVRAVAPLPVRDSSRPEDLVNLSHGDGLMIALAVLLATLALAVLVHALLISVRRDRTDHAVLRVLGRTPGQTRISLVWQSLTLGAAAFLVGVPLGLAAARALWTTYARRIGIIPDSFVPMSLVAMVLAGTIAVALAAAVVPAWLIGRSTLASALRSED
jgi:putative ABC transport system permease protein